MSTIGMVGLGLMGSGVAANILKHGRPMVLFEHPGNQPLEPLVAAGARTTADLSDLATSSDVLILCVTGTPQVEAVLFGEGGLAAAARPGTTVIDCSTSMPDSSERTARALAARGIGFLDAAMTRTPKEAAEGRLNLVVGGEAQTFAAMKPLLESFAENVVHAGPAGAGHRLKLIHNFVSLGFSAVLAEAAACARRAQVPTEVFLEVVGKGGGAGVVLDRFRPYLTDGDRGAFAFYIANALKDMSYYNAMTEAAGMEGEIARAVRDLYAAADARAGPGAVVPDLVEVLTGGDAP